MFPLGLKKQTEQKSNLPIFNQGHASCPTRTQPSLLVHGHRMLSLRDALDSPPPVAAAAGPVQV